MTFRQTFSALCFIGFSTGFSVPIQAAEIQSSDQTGVTSLPLSYEIYEASVPHLDLENCPVTLPQLESFCRATVLHNEIHVFAFSTEGDNLMIGFTSHAAENLAELLH